jgi:hypothetical protein
MTQVSFPFLFSSQSLSQPLLIHDKELDIALNFSHKCNGFRNSLKKAIHFEELSDVIHLISYRSKLRSKGINFNTLKQEK